ncbi:alpha/beta fold hydrolase [Frigidibacter sp. SD6-1]|uniref:alpha/beta hydrolase n=1 Tax=Frigidibacter sp. SD6-1 TaxID=3032581 RepID=UPI0024DFDAA6|nr:alpha/beta fold hydrolase [Frigidibacter sp. SD6-1]
MKRLLKGLLAACAALYLLVLISLYAFQRDLQYFPGHRAPSPEEVGLDGVEALFLTAPDGTRLRLWHAPPRPGHPTILYLHGNAGEIADRVGAFSYFQSRGYGVALLSYRGFADSGGAISEAGLIEDAETAYRWLTDGGVAAGDLIVIGESLGTGVAVQLAARHPVAALALEAPYTSTLDVARRSYWWLPLALLMKDQFRSLEHIKAVTAPLLILHGDSDTVIPYAQGERLFEAANAPKRFIPFPGRGHGIISDSAVWEEEARFFEEVLAGR